MEGSEKLTGQDKATLGFIWISSFIYALLNDQVISSPTPPSSSSFASPGHEQGGEPAVQRAGGAQFQSLHCWSPLGPGWLPPSLSSGHVHCTLYSLPSF